MTTTDQAELMCPVCGGDNRCAAAAVGSDTASQCWCFNVTISPAALAAVPAAAVGKRCLCPGCALREGDNASAG